MHYENILKKLKALSNLKAVEGMARFGISTENTYGVSIPNLRKMVKEIGRDHSLALKLWDSGIHEARILASMIDEPNQVTKKQMDAWIRDFDSWDVCDQCCMNLFDKTPFVWEKAIEWTDREKEFEKRAGFALMACLAWQDKESLDKKFLVFLPAIKREADDDRNYVKKAVNVSLRPNLLHHAPQILHIPIPLSKIPLWEVFITMFKTVGASAIISYNNKYIFEIQKSDKWNYNSSGEIEIGIGCIGGTIENSETPLETLQREVLEEIRTNIEIIEWDHPFTVTSDLNVYDINPKNESRNLFFHWFGTKEPYRKCRICVFLGKVIDDPFPDDLAGLLITDIKLLMECLENDFSLNQCLEKGMKIISKEEIPLKAKIKEVGTVKTIKELYKNHKIRIKHLLK